jgi:hypothetical protein
MTTHKVERKVSTRAQKVAAVEQVRYNCEHGLYTRTAHIQKEYGVHHVVGMLLEKGIIVENGTPHKYKWNSALPALEIVDSIWHLHGRSDVKNQTVPVPVPPKPVEAKPDVRVISDGVPQIDLKAVDKRNQHQHLESEIGMCLDMCTEYGISNVAKYIADVLIKKGVRFP